MYKKLTLVGILVALGLGIGSSSKADEVCAECITKAREAALREDISETDITSLNIPTGLPLIYELGEDLKPIKSYYLGDPEEAKKKAAAVANQAKAK